MKNQFHKFLRIFMVTIVFISLVNYSTAIASLLPSATIYNNLLSQVPTTTRQISSPETNSVSDFHQKIVLAVVAAILGFLANLILESLKKQREPKKQISYCKTLKKGIVDVENDIKEEISISYKGNATKNMSYILLDLENSGNRTIKNQELRFEFSENSEILDFFYDPRKPEREMVVEEVKDPGLNKYERKYNIGYIEPGKKLGFRFIVASPENQDIKMDFYPKNENDEVNFVSVLGKKKDDERDTIKNFIIICLIFLVIPSSMEGIFFSSMFSGFIAGIIRLLSLIFLIQRVEHFVEAVIDVAVIRQSQKRIQLENSGDIDYLVIQDNVSDSSVNMSIKKD